MPRPRKPKPTDIPEEVLDHFAGPARPLSQADVDTITRRFKKVLVERMLGGELTHHLGYPPGWKQARDDQQSSQWHERARPCSPMTAPLDIAMPRDRAGTFEPR